MRIQLISSTLSADSGFSCEIHASEGQLARVLWLSGFLPPRLLCTGLGNCGRCRVRFRTAAPEPVAGEELILGSADIALGVRLACRHYLTDRDIVEAASDGVLTLELPDDALKPEGSEHTSKKCEYTGKVGLALDLGTTTVCYEMVALEGEARGQRLACGHFLNPQAGAGSDVISRLALARDENKLTLLSDLVLRELVRICQDFPHLSAGVLAANTAMTDILLRRDVRHLAQAPYRLSHKGHELVTIEPLPPLYIPPRSGPFTGGDISCAFLEVAEREREYPWLLADLGTNTEFVLALSPTELFLSSVPTGPAMEGTGMRCGRLAEAGVWTSFALNSEGILGLCPDGERRGAKGISATGYISLLSLLRKLKLMDEEGHFVQSSSLPLGRKILARISEQQKRYVLKLGDGLFLDAEDVEEMLKVRAAWATAVEAMLQKAGLGFSDLRRIYLAGALGEHSDPGDLETLGFLPVGSKGRVVILGNAALAGARTLLLKPDLGQRLMKVMGCARVLALTDEPSFQSRFFDNMHFGIKQRREWT